MRLFSDLTPEDHWMLRNKYRNNRKKIRSAIKNDQAKIINHLNEWRVITIIAAIVCGCFILGRYEALLVMRETLSSLLTHSPLHIATLRCTDKIGCIASQATLACTSLDPAWHIRSTYTISRHETSASRRTESDFAVRGM